MIKAAKEAGKIVLKHYGKAGKLKFKAPRNIVTKVDLLSEKTIINVIKKKFPKHNILTEESDFIDKNSEYTWIIDPIDGTTNFVAQIPYFAVCIGLAKDNEVVMGVVYNPYTKELFHAEKGKGAYLNSKRIKVSKKTKLIDALLTFSLPNKIQLSKKTLGLISKNYGTCRSVRNIGSAALNVCYIAAGNYDLYFSLSLRAWDVAAAKIIVEEAGGKITNINNKKWEINDHTFVATNKILHNKFIKLLS